jgi:hypothetical protein
VRHLGCSLEFISPAAAMLKRAGFDIVIEAKDHTVVWPHNFHLGFELPSVDELSELYQHLLAQGVNMQTGLFQHERLALLLRRAGRPAVRDEHPRRRPRALPGQL